MNKNYRILLNIYKIYINNSIKLSIVYNNSPINIINIMINTK